MPTLFAEGSKAPIRPRARRSSRPTPASRAQCSDRAKSVYFAPPPAFSVQVCLLAAHGRSVVHRWHVSPAQPCRGVPRLAFPCPATSPGLSTHEPRPFAHRAGEQLGGHPASGGWAREVGGSCCKTRARAHGKWGGRAVMSRLNMRLGRPTLRCALRSHIFCKQRACGGWAVGSTRRSTCCTPVLAHSKKTTAHCHSPTTRPLQARAVTAAGAADVDLRALRLQHIHYGQY